MNDLPLKLLLVDDSVEDQSQYQDLLENLTEFKFEIDVAPTGAEALRKFDHRDYDCILLDYQLPDMDGIRILEKMGERGNPELPVVMVTGVGNEALAVRALRSGAADYIVKSGLTPESLFRAVQNAVHRHRSGERFRAERARFAREQRERMEAQEREILALAEAKKQHDRLDAFFKQVPSPVAVTHGHAGVLELINEPMHSLIRYGGHEHKLLATVAECFGTEVDKINRLVYASGRSFRANEFEIERDWRAEQKELRYFQMTVDPFREIDNTVSGTILMLSDVTDSVRARRLIEASELRARESEDRFRRIAEIIPYMLWVMDARGDGEYFNSNFLNYTGTRAEQNAGQAWFDHVHPLDRTGVEEMWRRSFASNEAFEATYRIRRARDGEYRWHLTRAMPLVDAEGECLKWYASSTDIHDQRLLTENLRDSEQRLRVATGTSKVGIWEIELESRATWRNFEHDQIFGYDRPCDRWSLDILIDHVIEEDRGRVAHALYYSLDESKPLDVEFRVVWPNHTLHWIWMRAGVDRGAGGVLRLAGTNVDITERKQREQDLRDARNNAVAANNTKTMFLANMSHEIRTPLNAIIGFTDLISSEDTGAAERRRYAETVRRNGRMLMQIIDDILDLSKIEAGKMEVCTEPTLLRTIVDDVTMLYGPAAREKGVDFEVEIDGELPDAIMTDPVRLRQIVSNVVNNAVKFTTQGRVQLRVRVIGAEGARASWISFAISDTGIGIGEEQQSRLFQPFAQADGTMTRRYGGTGLGLMLSRRLAKMLGGTFFLVRSRPGVGSTFELRLPFSSVDARPSVPATPRAVSVDGALKDLKVLLVDDSDDSRYLARRYLEGDEAQVTEARSAAEAMALLEGQDYDAIVTDVQMPQMDGHQFTRELRERGMTVPIIGLTAHAMAEDRQKSFESGMNAHVGKPGAAGRADRIDRPRDSTFELTPSGPMSIFGLSLSPGGEIGKRTSLRGWRPQGFGGSSPLLGTIFFPLSNCRHGIVPREIGDRSCGRPFGLPDLEVVNWREEKISFRNPKFLFLLPLRQCLSSSFLQ